MGTSTGSARTLTITAAQAEPLTGLVIVSYGCLDAHAAIPHTTWA